MGARGSASSALLTISALPARERRQLSRKARIRLGWGHDAEADAIYAGILEAEPGNEAALLGRLAVARKSGQPEEILARCAAAATVLPQRLDLRRQAVGALIQLNRLPEAKSVLLAMASIDREAADTQRAAAAFARARGDHETSLRHARALLRLAPNDVDLVLQAVRDLAALGRIADAIQELAPLLVVQSDNAEVLAQAGQLARLGGRNGEAAAHYAQAIALRPGHVKTLLGHAEVCLILGRDALAEASLGQAWAAAPTSLAMLLRLGGGFRLARRVEKAREVLEHACRMAPDRPEPWLQLARLAAQNGAPDAAMAVLRRARPLVGDAVPLWLAEVSLLFGRGLVEEAASSFARVRQRCPYHPMVAELTVNHAVAMGYFASAMEAVERFPEATPAERARRLEGAGRIAEARRRHAEARALFEAAIAESSSLAVAHEGLARTHLAMLRPEEALASLEASLGLQAAALKIRGRMAAPTRGVLGELINEARIHATATEAGRSAIEAGEWPALLQAVRAAPDLTVLAIAVLTKLRHQGALGFPEAGSGRAAIPRRIHQFWDAPLVPPDVAELMESWPAHNDGWEYRRYGAAEALDYLRSRFPPEVARAFRSARQPAQQADLFRLAVLLAEGGAYADADDRCVAPLDELLADAELLLWQEPLGSIANSFIATVPGHPVIEAALAQAVEATLRGDAETLWLSTGPGLLSRTLVQHLVGGGFVPAPDWRIVVLERWDLREFCMPCCKAAYKGGAQHWFNREAAAQSG